MLLAVRLHLGKEQRLFLIGQPILIVLLRAITTHQIDLEIIGNASYSNYDVLASVISNITRTDRFASIELGGFSYNSTSFGGKQTLSTELSPSPSKIYTWDASDVIKNNKGLGRGAIVVYTILVMVAPVAVLTLGIIMFIKRKFL